MPTFQLEDNGLISDNLRRCYSSWKDRPFLEGSTVAFVVDFALHSEWWPCLAMISLHRPDTVAAARANPLEFIAYKTRFF